MWRKVFLGLAAPTLALSGLTAVVIGATKPEASKIVCRGGCETGENCLARCGGVRQDTALTCCGRCRQGDDCLEKCGSAHGFRDQAK